MSERNIIQWSADNIYTLMLLSIMGDERLHATRAFVSQFAEQVAMVSDQERERLLQILDKWIRSGQVDGYTLPTDKETYAWMEGIIGTLIGIVE
jgi:hypothetical protein